MGWGLIINILWAPQYEWAGGGRVSEQVPISGGNAPSNPPLRQKKKEEAGLGYLANTHIFPTDTSVLPGAYIGSGLELIFEFHNISMGK